MLARRRLSPSEKARVIARQENRCACGCKETLIVGQIDFDHVRPLAIGGTNDLSNFVALARRHHIAKSAQETRERAKADRIKAKHEGTHLNARDRELQRILARTKQI